LNITGCPAQKPLIVFNAQLIGTVGKIDVSALQDSGAEGSLIHPRTISWHRLPTQHLSPPLSILNVDGTPNANGPIMHRTQQTLRLMTTMGEHHNKAASEQLSDHEPWDHAIDLKLDFKPKPCKWYLLLPME
jgi:hypothetical protein